MVANKRKDKALSADQIVRRAVAAVLPGRYPDPDYPNEIHPTAKRLLDCKALYAIAAQLIEDKNSAPVKHLFDVLMFLDYIKSAPAHHIQAYGKIDWASNQKKAVALLRQAAKLLNDPIKGDALGFARLLDVKPSDPERFNLDFSPPVKLDAPEDIAWWGEHDLLPALLLRFATALEKTPTEKIVSLGYRNYQWLIKEYAVNPNNIGRRGRARTSRGRTPAFLMRELNDKLPESLRLSGRRYSIIAELMHLAGDVDVTPEAVRSAIKRGVTYKTDRR